MSWYISQSLTTALPYVLLIEILFSFSFYPSNLLEFWVLSLRFPCFIGSSPSILLGFVFSPWNFAGFLVFCSSFFHYAGLWLLPPQFCCIWAVSPSILLHLAPTPSSLLYLTPSSSILLVFDSYPLDSSWYWLPLLWFHWILDHPLSILRVFFFLSFPFDLIKFRRLPLPSYWCRMYCRVCSRYPHPITAPYTPQGKHFSQTYIPLFLSHSPYSPRLTCIYTLYIKLSRLIFSKCPFHLRILNHFH